MSRQEQEDNQINKMNKKKSNFRPRYSSQLRILFRKSCENGEHHWLRRLRGVRCNASRLSHAELDSSPELDPGDPTEFGQLHRTLKVEFPWINVMGGCCGSDESHVEEVCKNIMGRKKIN